MIRVHLPGGIVLNFPDGTDPATMQTSVNKFQVGIGNRPAAPTVSPQADMAADLFMANTYPRMEDKREQLREIARRGDIGDRPFHEQPALPGPIPSHGISPLVAERRNALAEIGDRRLLGDEPALVEPEPAPDLLPAHAPSPLGAKLAQLDEIREEGDLGTEDFTDVAEPGWFPDPAKQGISQRSLRETVLDRGFGWAIGGAERAGLLPEGTRAAVRENQEEAFDRYLTAHPEGGMGRAMYLAAGDVAASTAGPQALLGPGAGALASRGAASLGAGPGLRALAGIAGGAVEGAGQAALDVIDLPPEERSRMVLLGAGMGGFSAIRGLGDEAAAGAGAVRRLADRLESRGSGPAPPPKEVRTAVLETFAEAKAAAVAGLPPEAHPAVLADVETRWQPALAAGGAAGDPVLAGMADQLQARKAPEIAAPPPLDAEAAFLARRERALRETPGADDRFVQPGSVREAFRPEAEILGVGRHRSRNTQDAALGLRAESSDAQALAQASLPLANAALEAGAGSPSLSPRTPRWASSHAEAVEQFGAFTEAHRGKAVDPADLPFALVDLPLTRWSDATEAGSSLRGGAQFFTLGDSDFYRTVRAPGWGDLTREGGAVPHAETFTPQNPLVYVRGPGLKVPRRLAKAAGGDPQSMRVHDLALIEHAEKRGHDAIVIINNSDDYIEVVKTKFAAPGVERRPPWLHQIADPAVVGQRQALAGTPWEHRTSVLETPEEMAQRLGPEEFTRQESYRQRFRDFKEKGWRSLLPRVDDPEAGFIQFGRNKPPAPPPDPAEAVMPRNEPTPPPLGPLGALQAAADRVTDQFLNREDALARRLRRSGHGAEADFIEQLQGRARGAGGMIDPQRKAGPVFEGTYVYDPNLYGPGKFGSRRTGDGVEAVFAGMDDAARWDFDKLAAARRHLQGVDRQAQAQLEYDWGRAQRLEELRQSRRADKASLQAMFGDIRAARADELRAVRRVSKAEMETRVREVVVRQETARAEDLGERASAVREKAFDAAQASRAAGGELGVRSQETARAALYARQLLRQELRAAVRTPRPGEIPPLDTTAGPRSPSAVFEADKMAMALRRVAERLGVAEGALHSLLARAGELETLGRQGARSAGRQAQVVGRAWSRLGNAMPEEAAARQQGNRSIASAQRVAMGIRDAATHRVPVVERPADIDLDIDPRGTTVAHEILADLEARYGVDVDPATGRRKIRQLEDQVERFRDWTVRAWMIPLKEAGRFSDQEFRYWQNPDGSYGYAGDILAKNDMYAPFQRLTEVLGDEADVYGLSPLANGKPNPIHEIHGFLSPDRPITRPSEAAIGIAQKAILWTERQRVRNVFADAVDSSPELQAEIRQLSPAGGVQGVGPKTGLPIHVRGSFPAWRNGVRTDYTAPPDVLRAVESMTPGQTYFVMEAAKLAARTLRAGATITLEFPFRNLGRDVQDAAVYGPGYNPVYKVLVDPVAGLLDTMGLGGGRWSKEMRANGGFLSGAVDSLRPQIEATIRDVTGQRGKVRARYETEIGGRFGERMTGGVGSAATTLLKTAFFPILAPMETLASGLESTAKVGAYRRMRLRGMGAGEAAVAARSVASPDFGQAGSFVREWNGIEAFVNAEFQDLNRFGRAMRRNPGTTTIKALAYLTLPAIANWYKNKDDEEYQRLPDWERIAFYHPAKLDNGRWVRIPRPLGMLNVAFSYGPQKLLERMAGEDPDAVEELGKAFVASTPLHFLPQRDTLTEGGHMDWLPSIAQPLAEVSAGPAGYSSHRQGPIDTTAVYPGSAPLPEDRVRDQTSGIARAAGKAFGVSPIKVDYLLQGYGAYWGRTLSQATGPLARAAGADPAASDTLMGRMAQGGSPQLPTQASDIPGVRGFISSPAIGFGADPVVKLYKLANSVRESVRSKDLAVERKDLTRYHAVLREHPEFRLDDKLKDDMKYLSELRKKRSEILDQPGLDPNVRLDLILSIDQRAAAFAGQRMHLYSDLLHYEK